MSYDPQSQPEEKKGLFGVIIHSFFVVPFLIAVFSILLFAAVRILTMEKRTVYDYLQDVKTGGLTKRWQGAFELSRILSAKDPVINEEHFTDEMLKAYQASLHDDDRVRQYLAMAMAKTGNPKFVDPLLSELVTEKDENLYAIISALGILKDSKSTDALLKYLSDDNPRIRLATVIALGNIAEHKTIEPLTLMLNDPEANVVWDAAIALAKMGDKSGKGVILKLMDRDYLNGYPNVDPQAKSRIMLVAMEVASQWEGPEINAILQKIFINDVNMNVRTKAHQLLSLKKI